MAALRCPTGKTDGTSVVYLDGDETVGEGEALILDNDNTADPYAIPEGTSVILNPSGVQGPIIGANISVIAATISLVINSMMPDDPADIDVEGTSPNSETEVAPCASRRRPGRRAFGIAAINHARPRRRQPHLQFDLHQ